MPQPEEYLKGFGLRQGMILAGYELFSIDLKHNTIRRYREYSYPIVMIWRPLNTGSNMAELIRQLESMVSQEKVIYTQYGYPYKCNFGHLEHHYEEADHVVINSMGYCQRI